MCKWNRGVCNKVKITNNSAVLQYSGYTVFDSTSTIFVVWDFHFLLPETSTPLMFNDIVNRRRIILY